MKTFDKNNKTGFTLTKEDFEWEFFPAGGNGGQKQNKTSSACRCVHRPSGSTGISRDERSQMQNKKLAFERCVGTKQFKAWCNIELTRMELKKSEAIPIERQVELEMLPHNIKVEVQDESGAWKPATK